MIAYGSKRRSGLMNLVSIDRVDLGHSFKMIGLSYVTCELEDPMEEFHSLDVNSVEDMIETTACVFLSERMGNLLIYLQLYIMIGMLAMICSKNVCQSFVQSYLESMYYN